MRNKWVDLMIRRGGLACAEMTFSQNHSPSNFRAMYRARAMYEAAVEPIGQESENRRRRHSARPATTQTAPPSKNLIPRPVLTEGVRTLCACLLSLKAYSRQKFLNRVGGSFVSAPHP